MKIVELNENDIVVLTVPTVLSKETEEKLRAQLDDLFPGRQKVILLVPGWELSIIKKPN